MKDGGPAFPTHNDIDCLEGMSLRDYFAARAIQGIRAGAYKKLVSKCGYDTRFYSSDEAAKLAYKDADAMLKAREAENGKS